MAKELAISSEEHPFIAAPNEFAREGQRIAHEVLEALGGYSGLTTQLPLDRGDTNRALVLLCLKLADAVDVNNRSLSESLRAEAYKLGSAAKLAGSPRQPIEVKDLSNALSAAWKHITQDERASIKATGDLVGEFGDILDTIKVLFVACRCPF